MVCSTLFGPMDFQDAITPRGSVGPVSSPGAPSIVSVIFCLYSGIVEVTVVPETSRVIVAGELSSNLVDFHVPNHPLVPDTRSLIVVVVSFDPSGRWFVNTDRIVLSSAESVISPDPVALPFA